MVITTTRKSAETGPSTAQPPDREAPATGHRVRLLEQILELNPSARTEFLAGFSDRALTDYRDHLTAAQTPRGPGATWIRPANMPAILVRADQE